MEDKKNAGHRDERLLLGVDTLSILSVDSEELIEIINDWRRTGAETYVADFILNLGDERRHLIAKACIKLSPREAMREWLSRRQLLHDKGVSTPDLFAVDGATIVEEYIPYSLAEAYEKADDEARDELTNNFVTAYKIMRDTGFKPMGLHDVRSRGTDVVIVDFGEDLGPPDFQRNGAASDYEQEAVKLLENILR